MSHSRQHVFIQRWANVWHIGELNSVAMINVCSKIWQTFLTKCLLDTNVPFVNVSCYSAFSLANIFLNTKRRKLSHMFLFGIVVE